MHIISSLLMIRTEDLARPRSTPNESRRECQGAGNGRCVIVRLDPAIDHDSTKLSNQPEAKEREINALRVRFCFGGDRRQARLCRITYDRRTDRNGVTDLSC